MGLDVENISGYGIYISKDLLSQAIKSEPKGDLLGDADEAFIGTQIEAKEYGSYYSGEEQCPKCEVKS